MNSCFGIAVRDAHGFGKVWLVYWSAREVRFAWSPSSSNPVVLEEAGSGFPDALLFQLGKYICLSAVVCSNFIHVDSGRYSSVP